jgi:hypothetical protein
MPVQSQNCTTCLELFPPDQPDLPHVAHAYPGANREVPRKRKVLELSRDPDALALEVADDVLATQLFPRPAGREEDHERALRSECTPRRGQADFRAVRQDPVGGLHNKLDRNGHARASQLRRLGRVDIHPFWPVGWNCEEQADEQ